MKVIIFGLGNYGRSLALNFAETGNEVFGVDNNMHHVEILKNNLTHVVCLDSTDEEAMQTLPLREADLAVVAIGENEGAAILTTALLKKNKVKRIIARSSSNVQDTVLQAMDIREIVHPELEAAIRLTKLINFKKTVDNFAVDEQHTISEIKVGPKIANKTIREIGIEFTYDLRVITILRQQVYKNNDGEELYKAETMGIITQDFMIIQGDILVVFGTNQAIQDFCDLM